MSWINLQGMSVLRRLVPCSKENWKISLKRSVLWRVKTLAVRNLKFTSYWGLSMISLRYV